MGETLATHLVISKADVLLLGTRALNELGEGEHADEEDGGAGSEDGRGGTVVGTDAEVVVVVADAACSGPLLLRGDGIVLGGANIN